MRQRSNSKTLNVSCQHEYLELREAEACCFEAAPPNWFSDEAENLSSTQILKWFATEKDSSIPPCFLLDVVTAIASGQFLSTARLGAKLIAEFGSIGNVLSADVGRLSIWLEKEGQNKWFAEQLILRLNATNTLIKRALSEKISNRPIISSCQLLHDYLKIAIGSESTEQFRLLFLDKKNILIKDEIQQKGTVDHTPLYPREVAKRSLELGASAIIMVHNHPSGDPTPSRADIEMTKQVEAALATIRVCVHDHLIIGANQYVSFKSKGLI